MQQRPASQHRYTVSATLSVFSAARTLAIRALLTLVLVTIGACSSSDEPTANNPGIQNDAAPSPAMSEDGIDLSGDILIPPPPAALFISAQPGELVLQWQSDVNTTSASIDLFNTRLRTTTRIISDLPADQTEFRLPVVPHLFAWEYSEFILSLCSATDCIHSLSTGVATLRDDTVTLLSATDGQMFDQYGASLAAAVDGRLLIAGAPGKNRISSSENELEQEVADAGVAELFFSVDGTWWHGALLESTTPGFNARFGDALASSRDGNTLVIGAPGDSHAGALAGSAFVFERTGETWRQSAELISPASEEFAQFGAAVAIDSEASLIAVAAPAQSNSSEPFANTGDTSGSVTIYRQADTNGPWSARQQLHSPLLQDGGRFGANLTLSHDAQTLVISSTSYREGVLEMASDDVSGATFVYEAQNSIFTLTDTLVPNPTMQSSSSPAMHTTLTHAMSSDAGVIVTAQQVIPAVAFNRNEIVEKPEVRLIVYQPDADGAYKQTAVLALHGVQSATTDVVLSVAGDGQTIAGTLLNGAESDNTVTVFSRDSDSPNSNAEIWRPVNLLTNPLLEPNNFGSSLAFSEDGSRLFIGADGGGPVFVY